MIEGFPRAAGGDRRPRLGGQPRVRGPGKKGPWTGRFLRMKLIEAGVTAKGFAAHAGKSDRHVRRVLQDPEKAPWWAYAAFRTLPTDYQEPFAGSATPGVPLHRQQPGGRRLAKD